MNRTTLIIRSKDCPANNPGGCRAVYCDICGSSWEEKVTEDDEGYRSLYIADLI